MSDTALATPRMCHPDCAREPHECRITQRSEIVSFVAWTPVYDGNGLMVNGDPNRFQVVRDCETCGEHWVVETSAEGQRVIKG